MRALVEGYLEGDGSQEQSGRIRLGFTRNYSLERDLRCLAARLGASLTLKPRQVKLGDRDFPSFLGEWRWTKTQHQNNKERTEIVEIRNSRARKFWDVSVSGDPHIFSLASGVLTHNSNPMPESVTDRPTSSHEKVFLMTKKPRYFYDADAVRVTFSDKTNVKRSGGTIAPSIKGVDGEFDNRESFERKALTSSGANLRNVWKIATHSFPGAHFATFPPALAKRCILAGTSAAGVCAGCGAPWVRQVEKKLVVESHRVSRREALLQSGYYNGKDRNNQGSNRGEDGHLASGRYDVTTTGWLPSCTCDAGRVPATVFDPFGGSGTVGIVAEELGRRSVITEISPEYCRMARERIDKQQPSLSLMG